MLNSLTPMQANHSLVTNFLDILKSKKLNLRKQNEDAAAAIGASLGLPRTSAIIMYDNCVSISQGAKSKSGKMFEKIFFDMLDSSVGRKVVVRQQKILGTKRTKLDGFVDSPVTDWYFSLSTTPRERKEGTWYKEADRAKRVSDDRNKSFRFLAITEDPIDKSLSAKLPSRIEYRSASDYDFLSQFIEEFQRSFMEK